MSNEWSGVALPWGPEIPSFIEPKEDADILRSSVLWIIMTRRGERVMLPEFGSDVPDSVFEQNDDELIALLTASVEDAIAQWDDRITFLGMETERNENALSLKIKWRNAQDPLAEPYQVATIELTPAMFGAEG